MRYECAKFFVCWMLWMVTFSAHSDSGYVFVSVFYIVAKKKCRFQMYACMHVSFKRFAIFVFGFVSSLSIRATQTNSVFKTSTQCVRVCIREYLCVSKAKRCGSFWFFCLHTNQHIALFPSVCSTNYLWVGFFLARHFVYLHLAWTQTKMQRGWK